MNDRYLYRAKRTDNGEWVTGTPLFYQDGSMTIYGQKQAQTVGFHIQNNGYCDRNTLCQCTGLRDKNGKLIWENDILDGHIKRGAAFYRCLVLWNECKARFDVRAVECNFPMTLDECTDDISMSGFDYEVIGNIFDNPELLEVGE